MTDTIAAIATPFGSGGIGVIRISGPDALEIAAAIFSRTREPARKPTPGHGSTSHTDLHELVSHQVTHGYILAGTDDVIDEVLLIPMKAPRSYTAEDVVEIQAHSGTIVLKQILELVLAKGARLSEPGEFTKRAFLNQRIDLTQAEAVADIINARSVSALRFAASQNLGELKQEIGTLRDQLVELLSLVEVSIDFPDDVASDDPAFADLESRGADILETVMARCQAFIRQNHDACFLKEGIRIAICGKPNVGKSSLMNRLLTREKSIVTAIPGTTRDPIEEGMNMNGIPFVITDTAGIHDTDDLVEIIGIEKAKDHIRDADLVLYMKEPGETVSLRDFNKMVPQGKKTILVVNKIDLVEEAAGGASEKPVFPEELSQLPRVEISALKDTGIGRLRDTIIDLCIRDLDMGGSAVIPNLRHTKALEETLTFLTAARDGMAGTPEPETLAIDIKNSIDSLGTITGETASLDILDTIFSNFCIGK